MKFVWWSLHESELWDGKHFLTKSPYQEPIPLSLIISHYRASWWKGNTHHFQILQSFKMMHVDVDKYSKESCENLLGCGKKGFRKGNIWKNKHLVNKISTITAARPFVRVLALYKGQNVSETTTKRRKYLCPQEKCLHYLLDSLSNPSKVKCTTKNWEKCFIFLTLHQ